MDQTILLSMVIFIFANIGTVISMFLWIRSEANSDRRENTQLIKAIHDEMKDFHNIIQAEMKDFHGRLCAIEERRLK